MVKFFVFVNGKRLIFGRNLYGKILYICHSYKLQQ